MLSSISPVPAVVLSCMGAPFGDLNLVRSLGEQGVPVVVVAEYAHAPAAASRYCIRQVVARDFTRHPDRLVEALAQLRRDLGCAPVVFPSADTDLARLIDAAPAQVAQIRSAVLDPELSAALSDKQRFHLLADELGLPVPQTFALQGLSVAQARALLLRQGRFPLIAKPAAPDAWHSDDLPSHIRHAKTLAIEDAAALERALAVLAPRLGQTLVQEFVPGDDAAHFDVHAYIDTQGVERAIYCGRKWRINPPHAGTGCCVETVDEPEAIRVARDVLARLRYRGLANINFKRHALTGEFKLFEVNPRVSQWHILPTRSGVNLPWLAYRDLTGAAPLPAPLSRPGLVYVNGPEDWRAFQIYRREGSVGWAAWLASWLRPHTVRQFWQASDPGPALALWRCAVARRLGFQHE